MVLIRQFCFKFQSDSINTQAEKRNVHRQEGFKFQSDSINTSARITTMLPTRSTLNSNLILLILLKSIIDHADYK